MAEGAYRQDGPTRRGIGMPGLRAVACVMFTLLPGLAIAAGSVAPQSPIACSFVSQCDRESQTCNEVSEAASYDPNAGTFAFLGITAQVYETGDDQGDLTISARYDTGDFVGVLSVTDTAGMSTSRLNPPAGEPAMIYYFGSCEAAAWPKS